MFFRLFFSFVFSFLLLITPILCTPNAQIAQLTFSPIVGEVAQKMVEECLEEYRKMVEIRPYIKIISGPETEAHPAFQNYLQEFKYLWVEFHAILNKVMHNNTPKNCQQIENSCQMSEEPPVVRPNGTIQLMLRPESLFCDFGKKFAFINRYFVEMKRQIKMEYKFIDEANIMMEKMKVSYQIGWEFAGKIGHLEIQRLAADVQMALGQIEFRHKFETVDKNWAQQMLTKLTEICKTFATEVEQNSRRNTFRLAAKALEEVKLQPTSSSSNQTEIEGTCDSLYKENMFKKLCVFAKKLAYLSKYRQIYGISSPSPNSVGFWLIKRKQNKSATKKMDECLDRMRNEYEEEVAKMGKNFWGPMKVQFLAKNAFERHAKGVKETIEAMKREEEEKEKRRRTTEGGGRSSTTRRSRAWPWGGAAK